MQKEIESKIKSFIINEKSLETAKLFKEHPPKWNDQNKRLVAQISCPPDAVHSGTLSFSRWKSFPIPENVDLGSNLKIQSKESFYEYGRENPNNNIYDWHLNFAHSHLFIAYSSGLFAQDEMQVTEHPALGSLREWLNNQKEIVPLTRTSEGPTPILVRGVERRVSIDTTPNLKLGRPEGLYGNNFAFASQKAIRNATKVINPPTISNIMAMEAPTGGRGFYSRKDIDYCFSALYSGFYAAKLDSEKAFYEQEKENENEKENEEKIQKPIVIINTGFWGCGAYGGNRQLMTILQILASRVAKVDEIIYYTGDKKGTQIFDQSLKILESIHKDKTQQKTEEILQKLFEMKFKWGFSDGN
ncbi:poly(adp-ribose) glycohydrolase [Anaeramoeba ignava]|uniref:Poly(Adp-ribose) glycohydrolase n=1 Tax=Anaeramoeba ignava TaxID=1746090 RepID=A0A9Q0LSF5_ANAIG|nr:poly(adp-ribose) glycohydrolase [Anaeramoeba ignava]